MPSSKKVTKKLNHIHIKGARSNNLKDIEVSIPKNELVVVTGLSGSGKSSLIMDTLYAEGQRRYVESLSSYARQFLMRMKKPEVDFIKGICPAIAIEQKVSSQNARSTVGTMTEIYDFLRLLFARIGHTYSPISGKEVKKNTITDVVDFILGQKKGTKAILYTFFPVKYQDRTLEVELNLLLQKGYTRIQVNGEIQHIEEFLSSKYSGLGLELNKIKDKFLILVDRFVVNNDPENRKRIADSVQTAFFESEGECEVEILNGEKKGFNNRFELDGIEFVEPNPSLFNFNNSLGACPKCEGYGRVMGIDEKKVIPDPTRSVFEETVACWKGEKHSRWQKRFIQESILIDFPIHRSYADLSTQEKELLWKGNNKIGGINNFFAEIEEKLYKIQNRVLIARYRGRTTCPTCNGARLRPEAMYVKIDGYSMADLVNKPIKKLADLFKSISLNDHDNEIGKRVLLEVNTRINTLLDVGLGYLTLDRLANSLSGGETQRINLTRMLGSNLSQSLYILDEPSVGLHPRDSLRLLKVLKNLRSLGNTVVVVEHEEEIIRNADYIIDIGPKAGVYGGEVVFSGSFSHFMNGGGKDSLTAKYLKEEMKIEKPTHRRKVANKICLKGARHHNLKSIDVTIPLNALSVISGVSGSGKTTLIKHILYPALLKELGMAYVKSPGNYTEITGDWNTLTQIEMISQNPIGKSSRSNPVTYVNAYDGIRKLMSDQQMAKIQGFAPKHFSFNVEGGRCDNCKGEGEITVEMQFLADIKLTCDDCGGKRFKKEVLEVKYKGKNIYDILTMSVGAALSFFESQRSILNKLSPLYDVGLGYVQLGQSSSTLSGGEAQRVKLASFLNKNSTLEQILFIFDEPTTGLHFHDIKKLLGAMNSLIENGHTVIVIEHNMDVIKSADWVIDLGPGGGEEGGDLLYQGTPEGLVKIKKSYTAQFLAEKL